MQLDGDGMSYIKKAAYEISVNENLGEFSIFLPKKREQKASWRKKAAVLIVVGKVKKRRFIVVVHNQKYKTSESQSIDCMEVCSYTSL